MIRERAAGKVPQNGSMGVRRQGRLLGPSDCLAQSQLAVYPGWTQILEHKRHWRKPTDTHTRINSTTGKNERRAASRLSSRAPPLFSTHKTARFSSLSKGHQERRADRLSNFRAAQYQGSEMTLGQPGTAAPASMPFQTDPFDRYEKIKVHITGAECSKSRTRRAKAFQISGEVGRIYKSKP